MAVALLSLGACGGNDNPGGGADMGPLDPETTQVEAHFRDSSVPPEYHRSWTLTLDREQVHLVVDSYGDTIAEETVAMPAGPWAEFVEELPDALQDLDEPESVERGCTGGTGMTLDATEAGSDDAHLDIDNCNTPGNQAISDDVIELLEPFTHLVHLDRHTRT